MKRLLALVASTSFVVGTLVVITAAPASAQVHPGDLTRTSGFAEGAAEAAAERNQANTEAAAGHAQGASEAAAGHAQGSAEEEAARQAAIAEEVKARTESAAGKECVREFRALSAANRALLESEVRFHQGFSRPEDFESSAVPAAEARFDALQEQIQANLFACLAKAELSSVS